MKLGSSICKEKEFVCLVHQINPSLTRLAVRVPTVRSSVAQAQHDEQPL